MLCFCQKETREERKNVELVVTCTAIKNVGFYTAEESVVAVAARKSVVLTVSLQCVSVLRVFEVFDVAVAVSLREGPSVLAAFS